MKKEAQLARIEELEAQLETISTDLEESKGAQMRALADLQNVQRREGDNKKNWVSFGIAEFVKPLIPRFVELQLGAEHSDDKDMQKAVEHFFKAIEKSGLQAINPKSGDTIDPDFHEVLLTEEGTPGTIVKVLELGWRFGNTVLAPAKISAAAQ